MRTSKQKSKFPGWFDPKNPPELAPSIKKAVEVHNDRIGQWKYLKSEWETDQKEERRRQYLELKKEFEE